MILCSLIVVFAMYLYIDLMTIGNIEVAMRHIFLIGANMINTSCSLG